MNDPIAPTTELPAETATAHHQAEGDFATGEHTEPTDAGTDLHEGDFASGERTTLEVPGGDPEADLHGDFAAGERTEPITVVDEVEGTFASTDS